jgi:cytochrome c oxidase cbb3-type subunit III
MGGDAVVRVYNGRKLGANTSAMRFHFLLLIAATTLSAQDHGSIAGKPFSGPEDLQAGMKSFRSACAACHGLEGGGGSNGPSLTTGAFKHGGSDEALSRTITRGIPDSPMAAFPLDGREVWRLIAYIRSLNVRRAAEQAKGSPARGAQVFAANGCAGCHTAGDTGGYTGPDLSDIGSRRSLAQLESSILDPNAEVSPDYWSLRARTRSGQTIAGIRMNEDMDSFQIREASGRLRSLTKASLAHYEIVHTSPMPDFKSKLQPSEVEDLVAYLAGLHAREVR